MVATNDEADCPLWHGEINCIRKVRSFSAHVDVASFDCLTAADNLSSTKFRVNVDLAHKIASF